MRFHLSADLDSLVDVAVVSTVAEQTDVLLIAKGLELCPHLDAAGFIVYLLNC